MTPKKEDKSFIPAGFSKVEENLKFYKFEDEGSYFHGYYLGFKEITSRLTGDTQNVWICKAAEDYIEQEIFKGELCHLGEKSAMAQKRLMLKDGQEFILVYVGERKGESGRRYKAFDLYIK